ncbi:MAG TPA: hypothetical protein VFS42_03265 [Burkholderiaceae bacterium]|nr:hypothetical protein [Burkholderiaceae bacterium]
MSPWLTLWSRTMETSLGAPEVIARRVQMFSTPWTMRPTDWFEANTMVAEKMLAASQFWWVMWGAMPGMLMSGRPPQITHAMRDLNRALQPMHRTVRGNVARLRKND